MKEFWLPFCLALGWTAYSARSDSDYRLVAKLVPTFSTAFFLCAWLTGNVVRVRRQAKVEGGIDKVESRVEHLINKLDDATSRLNATMTGGDSFAYIGMMERGTNLYEPHILHVGHNALSNVQSRMVDLQIFAKVFAAGNPQGADTVENVAELPVATGQAVSPPIHLSGPRHDFNIFFNARNGRWVQLLRMRKVSGTWIRAFVILRDDRVIYGQVPIGFPVTGEPQIDEFEKGNEPRYAT